MSAAPSRPLRRLLGAGAVVAALVTVPGVTAVPGAAVAGTSAAAVPSAAVPRTAVIGAATTGSPVLGRRVIGYSVQHRPIVAVHLGDPRVRARSLLIGQMHGDEPAGIRVARALISGAVPVRGVNLWVIATLNPDGSAAHTRQNAHRVDLNRNWPFSWRPLSGMYYSGTGPLSEPESRAVHRFLLRLRPQRIVSLHQPLYGVDATHGGQVDPAFRRALANDLGLPQKPFRCWSFCHGSMTGWYTQQHLGAAITVEFGWHPADAFLAGRAPRGILAAFRS